MPIEFAAETERDFALIFEHLVNSYMAFGESRAEALERAEARLAGILDDATRIATAPQRGSRHDDLMPGLRQLTGTRVASALPPMFGTEPAPGVVAGFCLPRITILRHSHEKARQNGNFREHGDARTKSGQRSGSGKPEHRHSATFRMAGQPITFSA